jgi:hypothetical protein
MPGLAMVWALEEPIKLKNRVEMTATPKARNLPFLINFLIIFSFFLGRRLLFPSGKARAFFKPADFSEEKGYVSHVGKNQLFFFPPPPFSFGLLIKKAHSLTQKVGCEKNPFHLLRTPLITASPAINEALKTGLSW